MSLTDLVLSTSPKLSPADTVLPSSGTCTSAVTGKAVIFRVTDSWPDLRVTSRSVGAVVTPSFSRAASGS